jgi:hypothetical protein
VVGLALAPQAHGVAAGGAGGRPRPPRAGLREQSRCQPRHMCGDGHDRLPSGACAPGTAWRWRSRRQGQVSAGCPGSSRLEPGHPATQPVSGAGSRPSGRSRHAGCRCR